MHDQISERITTAVATASVAAPVWLPWLKTVSDLAALLLPIFGVAWLIVQIVSKMMREK